MFSFNPELVNAAYKNNLGAVQLGKFLGVNKLPNWNEGGPNPKPIEVVAAMLCINCSFNNETFISKSAEVRERWETHCNRVLSNSLWDLQYRDCHLITNKAIKSMYLFN